jgi:maltose O-acetyltransferase
MPIDALWRGLARGAYRVSLPRVRASVRDAAQIDRLRRSGLDIGQRVFIGGGTFLDPDFAFLISIGDDTTVSVGVVVLAHDASTRGATGYSRLAPVRIGRRAFIGARALVLPGVTIGDDAIIGAGSVVTRDVEAGTVVAGNPARVITRTSEYLDRNRALMNQRPRWSRSGYTASDGVTPATARLMHEALRDGEAFIR